MKKPLALILQASVTAILLWLLFRDFEWTSFWRILRAMPGWFYLLSFGVMLAGQLLYAYRWRLMLEALGLGIPYRTVVEQYVVGIFFNNFLPSTMGGDWAKVYYLGRTEGYVRVGASVLVDRLLGIFLLSSMAVVLFWTRPVTDDNLIAARSMLTGIWLLLAAGFAMVLLLPVGLWLQQRLTKWRRIERQIDSLRRLADHITDVARQPRVIAGSSAAVVIYFMMLGVVYQQFIALTTGIVPGLLAVTAAVTAIATLSNVPIAVNGLGLREQLHLALLAGFALSREAAAGISLLLFGHLLLISAIGALLWLRGPATGPGSVRPVHPEAAQT
ncbi:MAG TPA: lysylphosphatidylglycerol synthase transmembrane domain-containing protein [Vicinamibacterales bacterium]|nr:lysylphosphatidylglycerol synthase transmembrane domain-containing protein [Vicinamibacterales bacterium]